MAQDEVQIKIQKDKDQMGLGFGNTENNQDGFQ
jgi:hypothetical protein